MRKLRKAHLQPYLDSLGAIAKCIRRARLASSQEEVKPLAVECAAKWEQLKLTESNIALDLFFHSALLPPDSEKKPIYDNWRQIWITSPSSLLIMKSMLLPRHELIQRAIAYEEYWQLPVTLEESIAWHEERQAQVADKQSEQTQ